MREIPSGVLLPKFAMESTERIGRVGGSPRGLRPTRPEEYGLGDNFYSTALTYSLPNHWDLIAGQSPSSVMSLGLEGVRAGHNANRTLYLHEAANTTSVEDLLANRTNVSWRYYDYALGSWGYRSNITSAKGGPTSHNAYDYWNPQASKQESYSAALSAHFVAGTQFFADAKAGNLPNLSWVIPYFHESDHPGANTTGAESWTASVLNAMECSLDWNSTAVFITFDEYGGIYDHLAPPVWKGQQLSLRVPLLVVSPYTPEGTVVHGLGDFASLLRLMECRYGLGCLTVMDCSAPLPLAYFHFGSGPRAPPLFDDRPLRATYPMPLQPAAAPWHPLAYSPPAPYVDDPLGDGVDVD